MTPLEFVLKEIEGCKAKMVGHNYNGNTHGFNEEEWRLKHLYEVVKIVEATHDR